VLVTHSEPQGRDEGPRACLSSLRNGAKAATDARRSTLDARRSTLGPMIPA
jgi:hypothetical protein